jgi:hypothetical protein
VVAHPQKRLGDGRTTYNDLGKSVSHICVINLVADLHGGDLGVGAPGKNLKNLKKHSLCTFNQNFKGALLGKIIGHPGLLFVLQTVIMRRK